MWCAHSHKPVLALAGFTPLLPHFYPNCQKYMYHMLAEKKQPQITYSRFGTKHESNFMAIINNDFTFWLLATYQPTVSCQYWAGKKLIQNSDGNSKETNIDGTVLRCSLWREVIHKPACPVSQTHKFIKRCTNLFPYASIWMQSIMITAYASSSLNRASDRMWRYDVH